MEHTKEPWIDNGWGDVRGVKEGRPGPEWLAEFSTDEDATRAVACVNALAGVKDPLVAIAALLAVVKEYSESTEENDSGLVFRSCCSAESDAPHDNECRAIAALALFPDKGRIIG